MDALYEKMQKRTFVFTLLMVIVHIPFLTEIIVLYPKLGPRKDLDNGLQYSELKQEDAELDDIDK